MGKIKGWRKIRKNQWENEKTSGYLVIYSKGGVRAGIARHPTNWYVDVDTGKALWSIGKRNGYSTQTEALKVATKYMKAHPKG